MYILRYAESFLRSEAALSARPTQLSASAASDPGARLAAASAQALELVNAQESVRREAAARDFLATVQASAVVPHVAKPTSISSVLASLREELASAKAAREDVDTLSVVSSFFF